MDSSSSSAAKRLAMPSSSSSSSSSSNSKRNLLAPLADVDALQLFKLDYYKAHSLIADAPISNLWKRILVRTYRENYEQKRRREEMDAYAASVSIEEYDVKRFPPDYVKRGPSKASRHEDYCSSSEEEETEEEDDEYEGVYIWNLVFLCVFVSFLIVAMQM